MTDRLSNTIKIDQYDLLIRIDFDPYNTITSKTLSYSGDVTISFRTLVSSTAQIVLHMDRNLALESSNSISVTNTDTTQVVNVLNSNYDASQKYIINLANNLVANANYALKISFKASTTINNGFYHHSYPESFTFRYYLKNIVLYFLKPIINQKCLYKNKDH